jgi:NAD+ diphosphatase
MSDELTDEQFRKMFSDPTAQALPKVPPKGPALPEDLPPDARAGVKPLSRSDRNHYATSGLARMSDERKDDAWVAAQLAGERAWLVPVWRSRSFVDPGEPPDNPPRAGVVAAPNNRHLVERADEVVFLGTRGADAFFAIDLSGIDGRPDAPESGPAIDAAGFERGEFLDLRFVGPQLARADGGMLAYGRGMLTWHRRHRFCGSCGAPTGSREGGHLRVCTSAACALQQFPRTDPAVIMLVIDGERCLLGRQARWPEGMYSTLAGFVEPGETLEAAVAREVYEEAGVRVSDVRYHSSQPWPFPTSLMLGYYATAEDTRIDDTLDELEEVRWVERAWILEQEAAGWPGSFRLPRRDSIARRLIEDWLQGEA